MLSNLVRNQKCLYLTGTATFQSGVKSQLSYRGEVRCRLSMEICLSWKAFIVLHSAVCRNCCVKNEKRELEREVQILLAFFISLCSFYVSLWCFASLCGHFVSLCSHFNGCPTRNFNSNFKHRPWVRLEALAQ